MAEYIGSRISLISKRDVRYVGILHEISSENSTVALEHVRSYGTEGRTEDEIAPSDNVYEYIVFRGSDVKDLRIEKEPEKKPEEAKIPDDPAILGNARPLGSTPTPAAGQQQTQAPGFQQQNFNHPPERGQPPRFPQQNPYPYGAYPPPNQRFNPYGGPQGFPPQNFQGMPYGPPPPGWYPPPGQGFPPGPPPGHMYNPNMQQGMPGQPPDPDSRSNGQNPDHIRSNDAQHGQQHMDQNEKMPATVKLPSPIKGQTSQAAPPPPTKSKPNVESALAPPSTTAPKSQPAAPKSGRIMPAVPMMSPNTKRVPMNGTTPSYASATAGTSSARDNVAGSTQSSQPSKRIIEDANRDARAAVAAAMANLPTGSGSTPQTGHMNQSHGTNDLTRKVNEMRINDHSRGPRQREGGRGGRGGLRDGRPRTESQTAKLDVPKTDYNFEEANAKFNKQDLVKEAIASGEPVVSPMEGTNGTHDTGAGASESLESSTALAGYNKTSSFFDNISSESKDRDEATNRKLGGREFRTEEQKKNLETFGQGSVDSYRGGFRGRGRGRGFRGGRGFSRGGRGGMRGRGGAVATEG